jgi:hypothetical protein
MLSIFKVLEIVTKIYTEEKKENGSRFAYWKNTYKKIPHIPQNAYYTKITQNEKNDIFIIKIRVILYEKLVITDKGIHDRLITLTEIRNNTIHPKQGKNVTPSKVDIIEWLNIVQKILRKL